MTHPTAAKLAAWYGPLHERWPETRGDPTPDAHAAAILTDAAIECMGTHGLAMEIVVYHRSGWTCVVEPNTGPRISECAPTLAEAVAKAALKLREAQA